MDDLKKALTLVVASLDALSANVKANTADQERMAEEMKRMAARGRLMDEDLQALKGTFASIGEHLTKLFERDAETQAWKKAMEARMEALEKKQPPAA